MKRMHLLFGVFACLLLIGGGCAAPAGDSTPDSASDDATGPIKVGFIAPLTGDAAIYGEPGKNVVAMAAEEINADGGVDGRPLEIIFEDGKCNGKDAANALTKLIETDGVQAVIGGFCSGESLAAAPIANANKVLLFSPGSSSPDLTSKGGPYFFRNYPSDASQSSILAHIAKKKGWGNVAIIHEQTDYAQALADAFKARYQELDGGDVAMEAFPSGTSDFRTIISKLKAGEPGALFISTQTVKPTELLLKQMEELNWDVQLMLSDAIITADFESINTDTIEGAFGAEFGYDADSESFQAFTNAYNEKYGTDTVPYVAYGQTEYDSVYMLRDALAEAGNNGEALREWFDNTTGWTGVSGVVEFDEHGDRTAGHEARIIVDGSLQSYSLTDEE